MTFSDNHPPKTIAVASHNPVKVEAALTGFQQMFPAETFSAQGFPVPSGVSDQPMSDLETLQGATTRARRLRDLQPDLDFAVGIEGGIERLGDSMFAFAWVVILADGQVGKARSGAFLLPPKVRELVDAGHELGVANDRVFGQHNSKQQGGAIGLLTDGVLGRRGLYDHAVVLALVPFKSCDLFPVSDTATVNCSHEPHQEP